MICRTNTWQAQLKTESTHEKTLVTPRGAAQNEFEFAILQLTMPKPYKCSFFYLNTRNTQYNNNGTLFVF